MTYTLLSFHKSGLPLYLETWKNLEFDNLGKKKNLENQELGNFEKNLQFFIILTYVVVKF